MSETPELDKRAEVIRSGKADLVQEFLDWLWDTKHFTFCQPVPESLHGYFAPAPQGSPEQLMAEFFGIDLAKIDAEQRALLARLREAQS